MQLFPPEGRRKGAGPCGQLFLPLTGPAANLVWLFAGASLQKLFAGHRRAVDIVMAAALALCAVSLVRPH